MKTIKLGHFNHPAFCDTEGESYPFDGVLNGVLYGGWGTNVLEHVKLALSLCDRCYFVLDDICGPLYPSRYFTHEELNYILSTPLIQDKVIFSLKGEEVPIEKVFKMFTC